MPSLSELSIFIKDVSVSPAWEEQTLAYLAALLSAANKSYNEVPSGLVDGVNKTFSVSHTPISGSMRVYLNGARLKSTDDYSISGSTITTVTAPLTGSNILCDYDY